MLRPAFFLNIAPDDANDVLVLLMSVQLQMLQNIFLYVDGVDLAAMSDNGARTPVFNHDAEIKLHRPDVEFLDLLSRRVIGIWRAITTRADIGNGQPALRRV